MMDSESLAQYGTPLKQLNEDNVFTAKAAQPSNQIVTDKQGRRRFHGAFTGGFSAGFFNSVGSKEGWTPSTFVSSRSNRAEKLSQNDPSVYMDDEDLNSFGIASEQIQATTDYGDLPLPKKRKKMHFEHDPIPGIPVLEDLIKPVNTTMGMKLLIKLGWRPGQGIGPRVSGNQKDEILAEQAKLFRKNVDKESTQESSESDGEDAPHPLAAIGFAPVDVEYGFWKDPKADFFGLGYKPLDKSNILGERGYSQSLKMIEKKKKLSIKGQAFGVGVFEDDDEDIYAKEDMSDYDFILTPSEESKREMNIMDYVANVHTIEKDLEGFCLSQKNLPKQLKIPLPQIPLNFRPYHESYSRRFDRRDDTISYRPSVGDRNRILFHQPSVEVRSGVKKPETLVPPIITSFQNTFIEMAPEKCLPSAIETEEKPLTPSPELLPMTKKGSEREPFKQLDALQKPFSLAISSRFVSSSSDEGPLVGFSKGLNTLAKCLNSERRKGVDDTIAKEEMKQDVKAAKMKMFGPLTQTSSRWQPDKILSKRFNVPHPFPNSSSAGGSSQSKAKPNVFSSLSDLKSLVNSPRENTLIISSKVQMVDLEEKNKEEENLNLPVSTNDQPTLDLFKAIFDNSSESEEEDNKVLPHLKLFDKKAFQIVDPQPGNGLEIGSSLKVQCKSPDRKDKPPCSTKGESELAILAEHCDSSRAKGLFKGIDFTALNEYRVGGEARKDASQDKPPNNPHRLLKDELPKPNSVSKDENKITDECRVDNIFPSLSDDEYGPEPPPHMRKGDTNLAHSSNSTTSNYSVIPTKHHYANKKKKHKGKHKKAKKKKKESKRSK